MLYAGGIMVLFLFVIMLVNLEQNIREYQFNKQWMVGTDRRRSRWAGCCCSSIARAATRFRQCSIRAIAGLKADNTQQIGLAAVRPVHVAV